MYKPNLNGERYESVTSKIVCVGRNYVEHAKELNNPIPEEPVLFIKPNSALTDFSGELVVSGIKHRVHYELEIAVLIGKKLALASRSEAEESIIGLGLGLDLTLRSVQSELKAKSLPWEISKAFDRSCPLSEFISMPDETNLESLGLQLTINGQTVQQAKSDAMITPVIDLIEFISQHFTLEPGDVILTGTPAGVGPLNIGDKLAAKLTATIPLSDDGSKEERSILDASLSIK